MLDGSDRLSAYRAHSGAATPAASGGDGIGALCSWTISSITSACATSGSPWPTGMRVVGDDAVSP